VFFFFVLWEGHEHHFITTVDSKMHPWLYIYVCVCVCVCVCVMLKDYITWVTHWLNHWSPSLIGEPATRHSKRIILSYVFFVLKILNYIHHRIICKGYRVALINNIFYLDWFILKSKSSWCLIHRFTGW
jgi:glucose-6-phosphate-specific signal transduction histidine kinase